MINYGKARTYKYSIQRSFLHLFFIFFFSFQQITICAQESRLIAITPVSHFSKLSLLDKISFSSEYGIISELHKTQKENDKVIIHIQDAHCNYEAQKNIYHILNKLVKDYKIDLVAQEGGEDYLNIDQFKYPSISRVETEKITDDYLKNGILTASETLLIDNIRSLDFKIFGVENRNDYLRNYKAFLSTIGEKEETAPFFKEVYKLLKRIKKRAFNNKLINFEKKRSEVVDAKQFNLKKQIDFLNEQLKVVNKNIIKRENVPNFERFNNIRNIEKRINYDVVEEEHETFYKHAKEILNDKAYKLFLNLYLQFKTSKISSYQYYKSISNYLSESGFTQPIVEQYQNFFKYAEIQKNYKEIYVSDLIDEISTIERSLRLSFCVTKHQKQLVKIERKIDILNKIINLKATNSEVSYFLNNKKSLDIKKIVKWLKRSAQKESLSFPYALKNDFFPVSQAFQKAQDFYLVALNRDHILINNLLHEMNVTGKKVAVLITGGFHTKGITDIIRQKQTSYAVISPAIKSEFSSDLYYQVMNKQQVNNHSALFSLPTHLAPVMLLDSGVFPKENNKSLEKLKVRLGIVDEDLTMDVLDKLAIPSNISALKEIIELVEDAIDEFSGKNDEVEETLIEFKAIVKNRYHSLVDNTASDVFKVLSNLANNIMPPVANGESDQNIILQNATFTEQRSNIDSYSFAPKNKKRNWKAEEIEELFDDFFNGETSPHTTSSAKSTYLRDMLEIIYIDPDGPPPDDPEEDGFGVAVISLKESILTKDVLAKLQVKYPPNQKPLEFTLALEFYEALHKNQSEEVLLLILRKMLGNARRVRMKQMIQKVDITSTEEFKKLLEDLSLEILDKEMDSLRDLGWRDSNVDNRAQYIQNIKTVIETFEVIPEHLHGAAIGTFAFRSDPKENSANVKLRFDPRMLKFLTHLKNNNFIGRFNDNSWFEYNPLESVIITELLHEWRGHFKHISNVEPWAVREQGSKYWVLGYSSSLLLRSLIVCGLPGNGQPLDRNVKNEIIQTAKEVFKEHQKSGYFWKGIKSLEKNIFDVFEFTLDNIVKTSSNNFELPPIIMQDIHPIALPNNGDYYTPLYQEAHGLRALDDIKTAEYNIGANAFAPRQLDDINTQVLFNNISKNREIQVRLKQDNNFRIDDLLYISKKFIGLNEVIKDQPESSALLKSLNLSDLISLYKLFHNIDYQFVLKQMPEEIDISFMKNLILAKKESKFFTENILGQIAGKLRILVETNLKADINMDDSEFVSILKTNLSSADNGSIDLVGYLRKNSSQASNMIYNLTTLVAQGLAINDLSMVTILDAMGDISLVKKVQGVVESEKQASLDIGALFKPSLDDVLVGSSLDRENYKKIESFLNRSNISHMDNLVQIGVSITQLDEKLKTKSSIDQFLSMLELKEMVTLFKLINNNNFKDVMDVLRKEFDVKNIRQLLLLKEDRKNLSQELITIIARKLNDTLQKDMDMKLELSAQALVALINKNLSSSTYKDVDCADVLTNHAGMLGKVSNAASFLSYNGFSFSDNSIISILNSIKSAESAKKEQKGKPVTLEVILGILGIQAQQIGEIITFFDYIFDEERITFTSDKESDKIISLIFQTIFAHHKYLYGGITKNEKTSMISPALIESLTATYDLNDAQIKKLKELSKAAFTSLELDSLGSFKFLAQSLLLQSQLFNQITGVTYQDNSFARFELKEDNIKLELGDRVIYIDKEKLDVEQIENWNSLIFRMDSTPQLAASFVYLVSQLIIDESTTKTLSHIFNEVIPDPNETVDHIINIIIDPDDSIETKEAQALLINTLQDAGKDSKLICVGDVKDIRNFQEDYQITKELNILKEPDNSNGAIVIGSGELFNRFKKSKRQGLFFLDSVNSPSGAMLMSIAFAFQNSKIIDNLKISANEQDQKNIESIWQILQDFTEDSQIQGFIMPKVVPLLKNLLKYLNNEELTIMVAA